MNKKLLSLCLAGLCTFCFPLSQVQATSISPTTDTSVQQPMTAGLISSYSLFVYASNGKLRANGATVGNYEMKKIGYKNVKIQRSSNGSDWTTEINYGDMLISDSLSYYLSDYGFSVAGGYYYRITCSHYAKESGLFGSSESISSTSNSVWVAVV